MWHGGLPWMGILKILTLLSNGLEEPTLKQPDPASHLAEVRALALLGWETLLALIFHTSLGSTGSPLGLLTG